MMTIILELIEFSAEKYTFLPSRNLMLPSMTELMSTILTMKLTPMATI